MVEKSVLIMHRREFIIRSGALSSGAIIAGNGFLASCRGSSKNKELSRHTIDRIEFGSANYHWPRLVGRNSRIGVHGQHKEDAYVKLYTDQGAMGWALTSPQIQEENELRESILGKNVNQLIIPSEGLVSGVHRAFDLALHDLAGVILDQPVYRMLGAAGPRENDIYSGMIYLDELDPEDNPSGVEKVLENCRWDYDYGYRQLKVKIGRSGRWYPHDEGLAMDIRITRMIHEEFGDKIDILVDANDMYSLQDTIDFLRGVEGVPIYWMEEPFEENIEEGRKLKEWMMANGREKTYYADGERQPDHEACLQLAGEGMLDVYLSDIRGYGFTPWRILMPSLIETNTLTSPHAWGSGLKTRYVSHIAAGLGNVCTIEGVTCLSDEIDYGDYKMVDGKLVVSDKPGFGMKLL
jgi:L-alanine-DL-glutamate epimerase-like enolase superfamily enzyme